MFLWDFVADKVMGQIVDWIYSKLLEFLGEFFGMMGSMGADLFDYDFVRAIIELFRLFGWALFVSGMVVAVFEIAVEFCAVCAIAIGKGGHFASSVNTFHHAVERTIGALIEELFARLVVTVKFGHIFVARSELLDQFSIVGILIEVHITRLFAWHHKECVVIHHIVGALAVDP